MSAAKFQQFSYKLFDPGFHSQRPIIVDEELESPDTVTLAYEEEAAVASANGGGLAMSMSAYKTQPPQVHGFADSPYSQFSPQSFSSQATDHPTPQQINNLAFGSNNATSTAQYAASSPSNDTAASVSLLSSHPTSGPAGTRVVLRVSSQLDLTACGQYAYVSFGAQKCAVDVCRSDIPSEDGSSWLFDITTDAPQFMLTNCPSPDAVPVTLYLDDDTESMARVVSGGSFTYHLDDAHGRGGPLASSGGATGDLGQECEDVRHTTDSPGHVQAHSSPATPPAQPQPQQEQQEHRQYQNHQHPHPPHLTVRTSDISSPTRHHQHHDQHQQHHHSQDNHLHQHSLQADPGTNTYPYSPVTGVPVAETQLDTEVQQIGNDVVVAATGYSQGSNDMLGSYRTRGSYSDQYRPPGLRHSGGVWSAYGAAQDAAERYDIVRGGALAHSHSSMMRPAITQSPRISHHLDSGSSNLTRTSILAASTQGHGYGSGIYSNGWAGSPPAPRKAELIMRPDQLNSMADINNWTQEEWANKRRIVVFERKQIGSQLTASCKAVPVGDRPATGICISCIWWAARKDCFVTSVDAIYLLERLIAPPKSKFEVEEKNRIRRNLEGFKPITVSKNRRDSEDFFKLIMGFGNPKPRNIEKDVKVFAWKALEPALRKIVSKYSYSPPSVMAGHTHHAAPTPLAPTHHLLTPVSLPALPTASYPGLPPTPVSATTATDPAMASGYVSMATTHAHTHLDSGLPSPRSLPPSSSWSAAYAPSHRTISPSLAKPLSPQLGSGMRISTLPSVYDTRSPHSARSTGAYGLHQQLHTSSQNHLHHGSVISATHGSGVSGTSRYDPYGVTVTSYAGPSHHEAYAHPNGHHGSAVYGTHTTYGGGGGTNRV